MMNCSINVHIGEVKIARQEQQLHTILGSCIGIGLLWRKRGVFGLAHCLLPKAPVGTSGIGGRYVDQALDSLLELMSITNTKDVRAIVAGGANMTKPDAEHPAALVGFQNATSAIQGLDERNIRIMHEATGGYEGRRMSICCSTGSYEIKPIPRIAA